MPTVNTLGAVNIIGAPGGQVPSTAVYNAGIASTPQGAIYVAGTPVAAQTAVPSIIAPNGTIATNGTVTLGTALPTTYANAWCYFPASAVVGGSAGMYFVKFSSTTVGQVYTNYVDASTTAHTPYIPSTLVATVGSNSAYTQTTAAYLPISNVAIFGNSMGLNGKLRVTQDYSIINNANSKTIRPQFGGATLAQNNPASALVAGLINTIINRGALNSQVSSLPVSVSGLGTGANAFTYASVDTSVNQSLIFYINMAVATDYAILEAFTVEVLPA